MTQQTLIIGGGIVGATLALKLAQAKHPVTIIDSRPVLNDSQWTTKLKNRDARVYALSLATIKLLTEVGVWQRIVDFGRKADYHQMQVWQTNGVGELYFADSVQSTDTADMNVMSGDDSANSERHLNNHLLGSMVEPLVIEYAISQQIQHLQQLQQQSLNNEKTTGYLSVISGRTVTEIDWLGDDTQGSDGIGKGYRVTLDNGDKVQGALLIGADGRGSSVRRFAGIELDTLDYQQTAISCAIRTEKPHLATARQAMLPTGTLALLPLADITEQDKKTPQHWQSVVWTLPTNQAIDLLSKDNQTIADELAFACGYELGKIEQIESIASFPLNAQQAKSYVKPNLALIGDAAHGVHPLAGQGLNLGMLDVIELAELLITDCQRSSGKQWGYWQTLQRYQRHRRANNSLMMHSFSLLNWMFAGEFAQLSAIQQLRSDGMAFVGRQNLLMKWLAKKASGL